MAAHAHLESFQNAWREEEAGERAERELDRSVAHLEQAVIESRRLVSGLRALVLEDLGLAGALEQLVREEKARAGWTAAEFVHNMAGRRLEDPLETTIFRVAQEALTNVRRHAQASRARVLLLLGDEEGQPTQGQLIEQGDGSGEPSSYVTLKVQDWGRGFVPGGGARASGNDYSHLGLQGMVERVHLVGGTFHLRSTPGEGTTVHAVFPTHLEPVLQSMAEHNSSEDNDGNDEEEVTQPNEKRHRGQAGPSPG
jgi:signal transduction histidine kinase